MKTKNLWLFSLKHTQKIIFGLFALLTPFTHAYAEEGSITRGAEKVKAVCAACHQASGISLSSDFPILAGQHEDYLQEALRAYKRGDRKNPIMKAQAESLNDQDIQDVSAYYSHQPAKLVTPKH
jgi:cytochrome c553